MPSIKFEMPEELMRGLNDVSRDFDNILEDTLHAGAEVIEKKMRSKLTNVIKAGGRSSGQLLGSLGISPSRKNDDGNYDVNVGFNEPRQDKRGVTTYKRKLKGGKISEYQLTNAMIANILEYGKKGQAPKPFMKPAERATRKAATEAAQSKFVEIVEGKLKNGG